MKKQISSLSSSILAPPSPRRSTLALAGVLGGLATLLLGSCSAAGPALPPGNEAQRKLQIVALLLHMNDTNQEMRRDDENMLRAYGKEIFPLLVQFFRQSGNSYFREHAVHLLT